jgi:allantoate deiminase
MQQLETACAREGFPTMRLPSGAGHDAMAIAAITEIGMLFIRCTKGISHNPAEAVLAEDVEAGTRVLYSFICNFGREFKYAR